MRLLQGVQGAPQVLKLSQRKGGLRPKVKLRNDGRAQKQKEGLCTPKGHSNKALLGGKGTVKWFKKKVSTNKENLVILKRLAPTTKSRASGSRSCGAAQKLSLKATKTRRNEAKARRSKASNGGVQCPDRDRLRYHCRRTSKSVCQRAVFT